jgi:hypothetical protein
MGEPGGAKPDQVSEEPQVAVEAIRDLDVPDEIPDAVRGGQSYVGPRPGSVNP